MGFDIDWTSLVDTRVRNTGRRLYIARALLPVRMRRDYVKRRDPYAYPYFELYHKNLGTRHFLWITLSSVQSIINNSHFSRLTRFASSLKMKPSPARRWRSTSQTHLPVASWIVSVTVRSAFLWFSSQVHPWNHAFTLIFSRFQCTSIAYNATLKLCVYHGSPVDDICPAVPRYTRLVKTTSNCPRECGLFIVQRKNTSDS